MQPTPVTIDAQRIADGLIAEAQAIQTYQQFHNDMAMCQNVFLQVQDDPLDEDLVARLITGPSHASSFRPQIYALMQTHNTAYLTPDQLRSLYQ